MTITVNIYGFKNYFSYTLKKITYVEAAPMTLHNI